MWLFVDGPVWTVLSQKVTNLRLPITGLTTCAHPDVRVCCPCLLYPFIDHCYSTCLLVFPRIFLLSSSYSNRVSIEDLTWPSTSLGLLPQLIIFPELVRYSIQDFFLCKLPVRLPLCFLTLKTFVFCLQLPLVCSCEFCLQSEFKGELHSVRGV